MDQLMAMVQEAGVEEVLRDVLFARKERERQREKSKRRYQAHPRPARAIMQSRPRGRPRKQITEQPVENTV